MKRIIAVVAIILLGTSTASAQLSIQDVRILMIVSQQAHNSLGTNSIFADIQDTVGEAFEDAGLYAPEFVLYPSNPSLNDGLLTKNAALGIAFLPAYITARNDAVADLILIVLKNHDLVSGTAVCGASYQMAAETIDLISDLTTGEHAINAESRHVAFVTLSQLNCLFSSFELNATHEIGHLLYAEHEIIYDNGVAVGEFESNNNVLKPFKQNHPAVSGSSRTIMYSTGPSFDGEFFSKQGATFDDSNLYADGDYEDVAKIMFDTSNQYVAHYRIPAPPSTAAMLIIPMGCWAGKIPQYDVSWAPGSSGGSPDSYEIQRMTNGSWAPWYDGDPNCIITNGTMGGVDFRIQTSNTGGLSDWLEYTLLGDCEEENPW